jgi:hypothetical protein
MDHGRRAAGAFAIVLATCASAPAFATNLNLRLQSGGVSVITVAPGTPVTWTLVGELSDNANEGLALFSVDLAWSGGPLPAAAAPTSNPMLNFARPAGVNNPAGFGGTPSEGQLLQVGGAQNTINSTFAPYPIGTVITGVAWPGQPVALATGQVTAPAQAGTYTLVPSNVVANVIRQGETGMPFWRVDKAAAGSMTFLIVQVSTTAAGDTRLGSRR